MKPGARLLADRSDMSRERQVSRRGATPMQPSRGPFYPLKVLWSVLAPLPWKRTLALLIAGTLAAVLPWAGMKTLDRLDRDIRSVAVTGELRGLSREKLESHLQPLLGRSFFTTDLLGIKNSMELEPWVDTAAVRREWPGKLVVDVVEQIPVAYWNEGQLLNVRGEVFQPEDLKPAGALLKLAGTEGRAKEVLEQAEWLRERLKQEGLVLTSMKMESRGAMQFWLDSGVEVALGRDHLESRLSRFNKVYRVALATQMDQVVRIDARYSNGVAVQWKDALLPVEKRS